MKTEHTMSARSSIRHHTRLGLSAALVLVVIIVLIWFVI